MNKEIEIPEGYEARIEGNKVILERRKSEDERIREELWKYFHDLQLSSDCEFSQSLTIDDILAYLERQKEQKLASGNSEKPNNHAEWSEEEKMHLANAILAVENEWGINSCTAKFLKSLRPQPKQESEPLEIKFAKKIYKVYGTKELPGGVIGYIIEDEPGHYDCIIHPDEVLGGGYGIKSNGSPYPTKEANFGQPHWKPSEGQMAVLKNAIHFYGKTVGKEVLESLYNDLEKYFNL